MNTVGRYDLVSKEVTHIPIPTPRSIVIDLQLPDGTVWFAEWRGNKMAEVVPDERQELTKRPCGYAAPDGHPYNPDPIENLLESTRAGEIAAPRLGSRPWSVVALLRPPMGAQTASA